MHDPRYENILDQLENPNSEGKKMGWPVILGGAGFALGCVFLVLGGVVASLDKRDYLFRNCEGDYDPHCADNEAGVIRYYATLFLSVGFTPVVGALLAGLRYGAQRLCAPSQPNSFSSVAWARTDLIIGLAGVVLAFLSYFYICSMQDQNVSDCIQPNSSAGDGVNLNESCVNQKIFASAALPAAALATSSCMVLVVMLAFLAKNSQPGLQSSGSVNGFQGALFANAPNAPVVDPSEQEMRNLPHYTND